LSIEATIKFDADKMIKEYGVTQKRMSRAITKALGTAGQLVRNAALRDPKAPRASGTLMRSIKVDVTKSKDTQTAHIGPLKSMAPYGKKVEDGGDRSATFARILTWVENKKITSTTKGLSQKRLAYVITASLKKKGAKPNPFMARAFAAALPKIPLEFDKALDKALSDKGGDK